MRIIDRYIGRQILTSTIIAVSVLTIVMVLGNIAKRLLSLPTEVLRDMPMDLLFRFIGYALMASLPFTVPWSLLTSVLLVFGRMSADNELLAMRMSGNSFARLCAPVFAIALVFTGICFWVNLHIAPLAQSEIRRLPTLVATSNPKALLTPDSIIDQIDDFVIYIGGKKEGDVLTNFQMIMLNEERHSSGYIAAREVKVTDNPEAQGLDLDLIDTTIVLRDEAKEGDLESGPRNVYRIKPPVRAGQISQTASLRSLYNKLEHVKPSMLGTAELSRQVEEAAVAAKDDPKGKKRPRHLRNQPTPIQHATTLRTELHRRFSFSLACLVFVGIGLPLGVTAQRRETSIGFALSLAVGISYIALLTLGGDILKDKASSYPWLIVWLPNVLFLGLGGWLFWRLQRR